MNLPETSESPVTDSNTEKTMELEDRKQGCCLKNREKDEACCKRSSAPCCNVIVKTACCNFKKSDRVAAETGLQSTRKCVGCRSKKCCKSLGAESAGEGCKAEAKEDVVSCSKDCANEGSSESENENENCCCRFEVQCCSPTEQGGCIHSAEDGSQKKESISQAAGSRDNTQCFNKKCSCSASLNMGCFIISIQRTCNSCSCKGSCCQCSVEASTASQAQNNCCCIIANCSKCDETCTCSENGNCECSKATCCRVLIKCVCEKVEGGTSTSCCTADCCKKGCYCTSAISGEKCCIPPQDCLCYAQGSAANENAKCCEIKMNCCSTKDQRCCQTILCAKDGKEVKKCNCETIRDGGNDTCCDKKSGCSVSMTSGCCSINIKSTCNSCTCTSANCSKCTCNSKNKENCDRCDSSCPSKSC